MGSREGSWVLTPDVKNLDVKRASELEHRHSESRALLTPSYQRTTMSMTSLQHWDPEASANNAIAQLKKWPTPVEANHEKAKSGPWGTVERSVVQSEITCAGHVHSVKLPCLSFAGHSGFAK